MGIVERRQEEKENLKNLIAEEAMSLYLEEGLDQLTIRNIAKRINYSPTTIYLYFKDKDHIFLELHDRAFAKLFQHMSQAVAIDDPLDRLARLGEEYIRFGVENPEMYDLMFILRAPMQVLKEDDCNEWKNGQAVFGLLHATVQDCLERKLFPSVDSSVLSISIWAHVHGLVSLAIRDRLLVKVPPEAIREVMHAAIVLQQRCMVDAGRFEGIKNMMS